MLELTNIRISSAIPLHDYLADNPGLSVRLLVDGDIYAATPFVRGDIQTGIWEINSSLPVQQVDQSHTLTVVANTRNHEEFSAATLEPRLFAGVQMRADECHEFSIQNHSIGFTVAFSIRATSSAGPTITPSQAGTDDSDDTEGEPRNTGPNTGQENLALPSKEDLEPSHASLTSTMDPSARAFVFLVRYIQSGDPSDISRAIPLLQEAVIDANDDNEYERVDHLITVLLLRYECNSSLADLEYAISLAGKAVGLMPDSHSSKPSHLATLGGALGQRFERLGNPSDIDHAISSLQKAIELTPDGHPVMIDRLKSLGDLLQVRYERLGNPEDLDNAISDLQKAVGLTSDDHPAKADRFVCLGGAFSKRFSSVGAFTDLDNAISNTQRAAELTPNSNPYKLARLNELGNLLQTRFERVGDIADIDNAISSHQDAVELTADDNADRPILLCGLGNALQRRFERLGNVADIDSSVSLKEKGVELMFETHPEKPSQLSNLGEALLTRFTRLGSLADIERAISSLQTAINLTPDGNPNKPTRLNSLGNALHRRFERFGSIADIDSAISLKERAVELIPDGHPEKPTLLNNLGSALQRRCERLGNTADVDRAILFLEKAMELTPDNHPDKARWLHNYANALNERFEHTDGIEDIDTAIPSQQKAVELTPDDHPMKAARLGTLANLLDARFKSLGNLTDIETAVSLQERAVELMPDGHPNKLVLLYNFGVTLIARYEHLHDRENLDDAIKALAKAANLLVGSAFARFQAARLWARTANKHSRSPLAAFACAIDLLPRIAWFGLAVADQHALLADVGDIVREAIAAAVVSEKYEIAVEWAEQGRSIVWQNLLGLRTPVDTLRATHPQLADRLQNVAIQLESSPFPGLVAGKMGVVPIADINHQYSDLAIEWEKIVEEIRRKPDFEGFLRPKRFSMLAPAAHEGAVAILNVQESRCDALLLLSEEGNVSVVDVPLKGFSYKTSQKLFHSMKALLASSGVRARGARKHEWVESKVGGEAKFEDILRILWLHVVKPVIERLAYQPKSTNPPRIWWCATGFLSFLPIHAAGLYGTGETGENVSDYVVSSYTPTLSAILDLAEPTVREDFQMLTIAQPSTPYATPIPKTDDEVKLVQGIASGVRVMKLSGEDATVERVVKEMNESSWIHFACHGQQTAKNAMESGFLLQDRILALWEIVKLTLPKADFAFLSACQTATGDENVAEESVHLAAGMLFAGCRGVVATMWSIRDEDGPQIAGDVYTRILKDGRPNRKEAAYALHEAVKRLRDSGARFTSWVPFIHIGR